MANKTFVAKNGLTANTSDVFMSQLSGTLTPTAAGAILIVDGTGQVGTRTEAQILSDIGAIASSTAVDSVTAGNGLTGGGTEGDITVTMGAPTTLTVSTNDTVGSTTHAHAITSSSDTSGGTAAILASDSDGDLKVRDFETGGDLVVGDDATLKSDSAVLGFGADTDTTLTHVADSGLTLNSSRRLNFGDTATYVHQSADAALDLVSDGSVNVTTGAAGVVLKGTTPKLTIGDAGAEDTMIVFDGNATDIRMGIDDSSDLFEIGTGSTHATTPAITIDTSQVVNFPNLPKLGGTALTATAAELNLLDGVSGLVQADFTKLAAVDSTAAELNKLDGVTATTAELNYVDVTSAGTSEASKAIITDAQGDIKVPDSDKFSFGAGNDMDVYHDGTNSYITNKTGALKLATETSGIAVTVGHTTSEVTIGDNLNVTGNAVVSGNLTVSGTTTTVSSSTINVADSLVALATNNNSSDAVDIGIYGLYDTSGSTDLYGGLFRDADDSGKWKLFKDNQAAPTTTVNTGGTGYAVGTLVANIEGNVTGNINGDLTGTLQTAAQGNVTSLGTLTSLTVDNVAIDGSTIGHTSDADLMTIASGALTLKGTLTVGVDDTGHDVKLFGATSGAYLQWDESADKLLTAGGAVIDIVKDKLLIGGTAVTTTAAELNLLDNVSGLVQADFTKLAAVDASDSELNLVDGSSAGTIVNSKAVIYGSSGEVNATTLQIGGTAITSTAAEINLIDGSSAGTAVASKAAIYSGTSGLVIGNEATIGSTSDDDAIRIGAGGSVCFSNNTVLYGSTNSSVAVASTQTFSGTVGTSATAVVFTFKGADGTSGTIVTGATNYQGGEIVLTLKKGSDVETKKLMIHHTGAPDSPGTNIFVTEFATLGTEIGETIAVSMGDADGTGLTSNSDKHVHLKLTNPSGTDAMTYAGVAHLVEIPGDS